MSYLWSKRWSVTRGWHWVRERAVNPDECSQWLAVFTADEPGVVFKVSRLCPR